MPQKGEHTWDLIYHYHRCPKCGKVIESREDFVYRLGKYQKEVVCERCQFRFLVTKERAPTIGPLIGDPQPAETEWGDPKW